MCRPVQSTVLTAMPHASRRCQGRDVAAKAPPAAFLKRRRRVLDAPPRKTLHLGRHGGHCCGVGKLHEVSSTRLVLLQSQPCFSLLFVLYIYLLFTASVVTSKIMPVVFKSP